MAVASEIVFLYFTPKPFNIGFCLSTFTPFSLLMLLWFLVLKLLKIKKKQPQWILVESCILHQWYLLNYSIESSYLSLEFISAIHWRAGNISTASVTTGTLLCFRSFRRWALLLNSTCKFDDKRALRNFKRVILSIS